MNGRIDPPSSLDRMAPQDLETLARQGRLVVAERAGVLVGCGFFTLRPESVYLGKLAVASECRGRGVLKRMVSLADDLARRHGKARLELETRIELTENRRTFEAVGFSVTGESSHAGYDRPTSLSLQRSIPMSEIEARTQIANARPGHNGGPPLDDPEDHVPPWGKGGIKTYFEWRSAHRAAWKVSPAIARRRVDKARACGLTYEEYTRVLLDTGRHLQPGDKEAIAAIIARRDA